MAVEQLVQGKALRCNPKVFKYEAKRVFGNRNLLNSHMSFFNVMQWNLNNYDV